MIQTNVKKIIDLIRVDAVFITDETLKSYITGFLTEGGFVLCDKTGLYLYTDDRYLESAEKLFKNTEIIVKKINYFFDYSKYLKKYKIIGVPFEYMTHTEYELLKKIGVRLVDCTPLFQKYMMIKTDFEVSSIKKACNIAEKGLLLTLPAIKQGMTEKELTAILEFNMKILGAENTSFDTIVAFGKNASVPHHVTDNTVLKFGDEILIDFGCKVNGYCSDITRTMLFGDDGKHENFKKAYNCVLKAHELVNKKLKSGMKASDADKIARDFLTKFGYEKLFTHSLGHGIGLNIHEKPYLNKNNNEILQNGMVFSNEPGIYVEGKFGIRIEDTVMLKNGNVVSLTNKTEKKLIIL